MSLPDKDAISVLELISSKRTRYDAAGEERNHISGLSRWFPMGIGVLSFG